MTSNGRTESHKYIYLQMAYNKKGKEDQITNYNII